jgi:hypothetical protein
MLSGGLALVLAACGGPGSPGQADGAAAVPATAGPVAAGPVAAGPVATVTAGSATAGRPASANGAAAASSGAIFDGPARFWSGSDSWPIPVTGSAPYTTPSLGGAYAGYVGMAGNWARWQGCGTGNFLAWSSANSQQAGTDYTRYGKGIGTGVYWYMGGPGVDPHWNGTAAEASAWGARQAAAALASAAREHVTYPVLFMDIEMPGIAPAPDNGWNDVYTSPCSGVRGAGHVSPSIDRAEFNGFADYLTAHSHYKPGVYSDAGIWAQIFGSGGAAHIPHTYEWTYEPETANLRDAPSGWCLRDDQGCAQFFGGVTGDSGYAVMWQWSGGGGVRNPIGDFDQIDTGPVS